MIAFSVLNKQVRCYALDRILLINVISDKTFSMPEDFYPDEYFEYCYGIIHDDEQETQIVRIRVTENQAKYVVSLSLNY